jgi:hypothetical protein
MKYLPIFPEKKLLKKRILQLPAALGRAMAKLNKFLELSDSQSRLYANNKNNLVLQTYGTRFRKLISKSRKKKTKEFRKKPRLVLRCYDLEAQGSNPDQPLPKD